MTKYKVQRLTRISEEHYDVDLYSPGGWFSSLKCLSDTRIHYRPSLSKMVVNNKYLHNMTEIINAYPIEIGQLHVFPANSYPLAYTL